MTPSQEVCAALSPHVKVLPFGVGQVRAVLHRDVGEEAFERALATLAHYFNKGD